LIASANQPGGDPQVSGAGKHAAIQDVIRSCFAARGMFWRGRRLPSRKSWPEAKSASKSLKRALQPVRLCDIRHSPPAPVRLSAQGGYIVDLAKDCLFIDFIPVAETNPSIIGNLPARGWRIANDGLHPMYSFAIFPVQTLSGQGETCVLCARMKAGRFRRVMLGLQPTECHEGNQRFPKR
jgi:hypothetical protein